MSESDYEDLDLWSFFNDREYFGVIPVIRVKYGGVVSGVVRSHLVQDEVVGGRRLYNLDPVKGMDLGCKGSKGGSECG